MNIKTIPYNVEHAFRGLGDLYLPSKKTSNYPILLIHGGGWGAMDKDGVCGIAQFLCDELGYPVYNINYRLCGTNAWPAGGDDCLEAAKFLLNSSIEEFSSLNRDKIIIIGASAGGHLALFAGLQLPNEKVAGIVSISGISSIIPDYKMSPARYKNLLGQEPTLVLLAQLEPIQFLTKNSPPILLTHEYNDNVVPIATPIEFCKAAKEVGFTPKTFFYQKEETGYSHRIWIPESSPHKLYRDIELEIKKFLFSL
jgi:acetyl esterase/lipase